MSEGSSIDGGKDDLIYVAAGGLGALLLGVALVPLREAVETPSLAFPFLLLTILIAEFGGRRAAVATALVSALSLDFFLTEPYLRLAISDDHDIVAFLGLASCGLVAAWFGSRRAAGAALAESLRRHVELLRQAHHLLAERGPEEPALASILSSTVRLLPLVGAVVRDDGGNAVASAGRSREKAPPTEILRPDLPLASRAVPFPSNGGRVELLAGGRHAGWLDLWGNGAPADAESRRTLSDVGLVLGMLLERLAHEKAAAGRG